MVLVASLLSFQKVTSITKASKFNFFDKKTSMLAEMHYNLYLNNFKKGEVTPVSNLGDAAFFDVHGTDLKSLSRNNKHLHVRYSNITFTIMADYQSNTDVPCFYSDVEMIAFAKVIISNL